MKSDLMATKEEIKKLKAIKQEIAVLNQKAKVLETAIKRLSKEIVP